LIEVFYFLFASGAAYVSALEKGRLFVRKLFRCLLGHADVDEDDVISRIDDEVLQAAACSLFDKVSLL
jgi:hypothetical protein